ncbi:MAG TPA: LPS export ABC transporter periplasmic protein LptC [Pyrinomonadaceae bacterium]|nr:LPS export ABC transporter periplasmic protein LptC [Pyrinomonadaceae bacterium]
MIGLRARAPLILRVLASLALVGSLIYVGVAYYRGRNNKPFRLIPGKAELSTTVERRIENYERRVTEGNRLTMFVRASVATSYSDGHHELENAHIEYYAAGHELPDKIDAKQAIYFVETESAVFNGNVQIETRDRLVAKAETITYDVRSESADVPVPVTFARDNVEGRSDSAKVDAKNKNLQLRGNVEINVKPDAQGKPQTPEAARRNRPVKVRAPRADFDHAHMHLAFSGGATAEQETDVMSGETLSGILNAERRLERIEARGNAYLRTMDAGRAAEVSAANMNFKFDANQQLQEALATENVRARTLDADAEMQLQAPSFLQVFFTATGEQSLLKEMHAGGRSVVTLAAPRSRANDSQAANKKLTANSVKLFWRVGGKDLERAEAVGDAELIVEPVQQTPAADRKTLNAGRFDCTFYEAGNLARQFDATGGAKAVLTPVQQGTPPRSVRTIMSQKMNASFARDTQDVERLEAAGDAVFNDADRNGQADTVVYTTSDEWVRLRGGAPVVWDSRARLKATEIDSDSRRKISYARGKAQTTYYSQEQTNGATPFSKVKSPVFITSNAVEFQHDAGVGIYTGAARAWQDDNFVSADKITLRRDNRRMEADGRVQSALYQARRRETTGVRTVVPVYATSERMFYSDTDRLLRYDGNVDIKQGTERITAEVADVYLMKGVGEVERMVAQRNVVVTQPGKRGTGNWAQYSATDETVMLTGEPARVEDAQQGNSESRRLTVYLRENRVVSDDPGGSNSTGRVRSTHKIRRQ